MTTTASNILPSIHCSSEWHLRDNPRAATIYNLALRLSNGGKACFFLSQPQVSRYFGWSLNAVKAAFRLLKNSGLFILTQRGKGGDVRCDNFANVYTVLTHSELPINGKHWIRPEKTPRAKNDPRSENDLGQYMTNPQGENCPTPRAENDLLVFDVSTKKSTNDFGADRASPDWFDPDDWVSQLMEEEAEIIRSIPLELTKWVSRLQPLPKGSSPLAEDDAVKAFTTISELLANGAARLFGEKRGSTSTLLDYDRIWDLDEKYGAGTTTALANKILELGVATDDPHPISVKTFVWNHLTDQLLDALPS